MTDIPTHADVVIIGAGIAGTATAWYLAQKGIKAVVCEKGRIAGEQSSRNWGFVRQQGRDPAEIPLMMEANRIWRGLERELNADLEWRAGGNLVVFRAEEDRVQFEKWMEHAKAHGLDSRLVDQNEIQRIAPGTTLGSHGGIYTESDGQAEPRKATAAIARSAEARGATFIENCAVFKVLQEGGRVTGVQTEHGEIKASRVVLATGAWSSKMLNRLGLKFPQMWVLGSVGRTEPAPKIADSAIWAGVAMRQRDDGRITFANRSADADITLQSILHARAFLKLGQSFTGDYSLHLKKVFFDTALGHFSDSALQAELLRYRVLDPKPNQKALNNGFNQLRAAYPALKDIKLQTSWAGYIELTPDLLPVIDAIDTPDGMVIATGFSGHGFGMGPIIGKLVSELVAGEETSHDLHPFRLRRFTDGSAVAPGTAV
jgi:glycine/D-amino acid oxidase-like deaminating enzyme